MFSKIIKWTITSDPAVLSNNLKLLKKNPLYWNNRDKYICLITLNKKWSPLLLCCSTSDVKLELFGSTTLDKLAMVVVSWLAELEVLGSTPATSKLFQENLMSLYHSVQMSTQSWLWLRCMCWQQTVPNRYIEIKFDVGYFQWYMAMEAHFWPKFIYSL